MPIKVGPNPIGALQSRIPNPFAPKLRNSQFGPNGSSWNFLAHTLIVSALDAKYDQYNIFIYALIYALIYLSFKCTFKKETKTVTFPTLTFCLKL